MIKVVGESSVHYHFCGPKAETVELIRSLCSVPGIWSLDDMSVYTETLLQQPYQFVHSCTVLYARPSLLHSSALCVYTVKVAGK